MKKKWLRVRNSLVTQTLLSVAFRIAAVIAILTAVSFWHVFNIMEERKLAEISIYTSERGARESQIFELAQDNHQLLKNDLLESFQYEDPAHYIQLFDQLTIEQPDGAFRSDPALFDGTKTAGIWVADNVELTDDLKFRAQLFKALNTDYGKAWRGRFINTYILGPENFATSYWPEIPDFIYRLDGDFDIRKEEYFTVSVLENNPSKQSAWTGLYFDQQAEFWMVSVETPVYDANRHIATIGSDIALDELFKRTLAGEDQGYKLIIKPNGQLIASSQYIDQIKENSGKFNVITDGDNTINLIYDAVKEAPKNKPFKLASIDAYLFVTELKGPGWLYINVVPTKVLTEVATNTAAIVLLIGLIGLIAELIVLYLIMTKKIASPLIQLTKATSEIARGKIDADSKVIIERQDELGRLARSFNNMSLRLNRRDQALFIHQRKFQNAFAHSPIGMAIVSLDGYIIEANKNLVNSLGYDEQELRYMQYSDLLEDNEKAISDQNKAKILAGELESYEAERKFKTRDGRIFWCLINVSVHIDAEGQAEYAFIQSLDINERKNAEAELNRLAFHDPLTSLANRTLLIEFLEQSISLYQRDHKHEFAVLFLDLDGFKLVNDSLGHLAGDELLKAIAKRLQDHVRDADVLARFGGDEFCILVKEFEQEAEVIEIACRVKDALNEAFYIGTEKLNVSASVGIVLASESADSAEDYLRDADSAMYSAKQKGSGNYAIFNALMHKEAKNQLRLRNELTQAFESEEFTVFYQPLIDSKSGTISGFESLVRWNHPIKGLVPPDDFLPTAETMGLIEKIDLWVISQALMQLKVWRSQYHQKELTISCNASSILISNEEVVDEIEQLIEKHDVPAHCLNIEVTESVFINDTTKTLNILLNLKKIGVNIHLDDFGTGYSSLNYLTRFPIDTLKIDRSFIRRIDQNEKDKSIVESIQLLANRLGINVTAEGVESEEHFDMLKQIGVDNTQGYYHGKPEPAEKCCDLFQ